MEKLKVLDFAKLEKIEAFIIAPLVLSVLVHIFDKNNNLKSKKFGLINVCGIYR